MDFSQNKLSKEEWDSLEKPVSESEKYILNLLIRGFDNPGICENPNLSLFQFIKTEKTEEMEYYLYKSYFNETIEKYISKYGKDKITNIISGSLAGKELKSLKSGDNIRLQHLKSTIESSRDKIFEFLLVEITCQIIKLFYKNKKKYIYYYYTLVHLLELKIESLNSYVLSFCNKVIENYKDEIDVSQMVLHAQELIEKNSYLLKYENKQLFTHQKQLYQLIKNNPLNESRLILYTAPTGTGKTLTPIGLTKQYKVIFVCVARHIGLALAKSAISVGKKIAFGFGCKTASDIRLHYFAAKDFKKDWNSGGIFKVNNSVGDNVEIMICDVQSYITCMHYMLSFNRKEQLVTFWDEPTITLDYRSHVLHDTIKKNWSENQIPTMILSCATLPEKQEISEIEVDFKNKFMDYSENSEMYSISSFDCKKSISLLDKEGYCVLPHYLFENYSDLIECADYLDKNKTLLRYFDLQEIVDFIYFINENDYIDERFGIDVYFEEDILKINMNEIKLYYIFLLRKIVSEKYQTLYNYFQSNKKKKFDLANTELIRSKSLDAVSTQKPGGMLQRTQSCYGNVNKNHQSTGISLTTSDAFTLTDGPTIFLADDVEKIGNFYIQNTKIPNEIFENILKKISSNNTIVEEISKLERSSCFLEKSSNENEEEGKKKKGNSDNFKLNKEAQQLQSQIDKLRKKIYYVSLDSKFVPNSVNHQKLWTPNGEVYENAYVSNIGEEMTKKIMALPVENYCKVLLLLGIGLFSTHNNRDYVEIIKQLAEEQRLFIIIASSDYIYGTNYQFCHGFLGKDLQELTQQKIIQAMGRVGRNNIQQQYTIRFRDTDMIRKIFTRQEENIEAINLCRLFSSD